MRPHLSMPCRAGQRRRGYGGGSRILQTPAAIAILNDDLTYRVIFRTVAEVNAALSWMKHHRHYQKHIARAPDLTTHGQPLCDRCYRGVARVTERHRRSDFGHMQVEVTYRSRRVRASEAPAFTASIEGFEADTTACLEACLRTRQLSSGSATLSGRRDGRRRRVAADVQAGAGVRRPHRHLVGRGSGRARISVSGGQLMATRSPALPSREVSAPSSLTEWPHAWKLVAQSRGRSGLRTPNLGLGYKFVVSNKGA